MFKPTTVNQAISLARLREATLDCGSKNSKQPILRFPFSVKTRPSLIGSGTSLRPLVSKSMSVPSSPGLGVPNVVPSSNASSGSPLLVKRLTP